MARAQPDGYTLLLAYSGTHVVNPAMFNSLQWDPVKSFVPIALLITSPQVIAISNKVPAKTLSEFVVWAKANPGKINYASSGNGSVQHIGSELLAMRTGVEMVHVPYKGSNEAMVGMMGGHVDMVVIGVPPTLPHIKAGRVRPLAVLAAERLPYLADVPTAKEAGIANYEVITWYVIAVPAGTPRDIVLRLNAEWVKAADTADVKERMHASGFEPMASTPEQASDFVKAEIVRWAQVIKDANLKVDP